MWYSKNQHKIKSSLKFLQLSAMIYETSQPEIYPISCKFQFFSNLFQLKVNRVSTWPLSKFRTSLLSNLEINAFLLKTDQHLEYFNARTVLKLV